MAKLFFKEGDWISKSTMERVFQLKGYSRGIRISKAQNVIVCISVDKKKDIPYQDRWYSHDKWDGVEYTGEGLDGDQKLKRGNRKLKDKAKAFFFRKVENQYLYCGEFILVPDNNNPRMIPETDAQGNLRIVYKFNMKYVNDRYPTKLKQEMERLQTKQDFKKIELFLKNLPKPKLQELINKADDEVLKSYLKIFL